MPLMAHKPLNFKKEHPIWGMTVGPQWENQWFFFGLSSWLDFNGYLRETLDQMFTNPWICNLFFYYVVVFSFSFTHEEWQAIGDWESFSISWHHRNQGVIFITHKQEVLMTDIWLDLCGISAADVFSKNGLWDITLRR